jgi:hypothetical protein
MIQKRIMGGDVEGALPPTHAVRPPGVFAEEMKPNF